MSSAEKTREYYDAHVGEYDRRTRFDLVGGQSYNLERHYLPFLERAVPRVGRVLELGCGTGFYTRWLVDRSLEVVGMDISERMVERARDRCPDAAFAVGDCQDPAAALGAHLVGDGFDAIVGINTFSYYPNKREALARYWDLLRPDGTLVFLDMNGTSFTQQIAYLLNYRDARRFRANVDQSTPEALTTMLTEADFRVEELDRFTFVPNEAGPFLTALLGPVDRVLSHLPGAAHFAIRLSLVARRLPSQPSSQSAVT